MGSEPPFRQDLPPPGGYRKFNFDRTFPKVFWRPSLVVGFLGVSTVYGIYHTKYDQRVKKTEKFEDVDLFNALEPFYKAERDRNWLKFLKKNRELEEDVMKKVPGWKVGTWYGEPVYFTLGDRWLDPRGPEVFAHSWPDQFTREITWRHHSEYAGPKWYDKYLPEIVRRYVW